jgi:hypothetical protein
MEAQTQRPKGPLVPDHTGILIAASVLFIAGWGGLFMLVMHLFPFPQQLWMFFMLLNAAVTGTALPFVRYLNIRFTRPGRRAAPGHVLMRRAIWVGLVITTWAWLQIPRALNWVMAFFVALVPIVIEIFLWLRERSQARG